MRAQEDLANEIQDDDVRWLYKTAPGQQSGNTIRVAVLGPTQVGKTTVILRLLRLTKEGERLLGQILRGGSKQGQSASATATVYGDSPSDRFTYREAPERVEVDLSGEELRERLSDLRMRVENGRFQSTDAVYIGLPARYFSDQAHLGMRIIDLPGLDARSEDERALTSRLVERYLPLSTLTLLVERADNLAGLGFLNVPGIGEGWLSFPERHAIVLTRAVSAASVQAAISAGHITSLADLQEFYREEIIHSLSALDQSNGRCQDLEAAIEKLDIFPVDLGQSRNKLPEEVRTVMDPVLEEAENALLTRVTRASEPAGALVLTAGLHRAATSILKKIETTYEDQIKELEAKKASVKNSKQLIKKQIARIENELEKISQKHLEIANITNRMKGREIRLDPMSYDDINVVKLKSYLSNHAQRCREAARQASIDARTQELELTPDLEDQVERAFEKQVSHIRSVLKDYLLPWYLYKKTANSDARAVYVEVKRGVEAAADVIRSAIDAAARRVLDETNSSREKLCKKKRALEIKYSEEKAIIEKLECEIEKTKESLQERKERIIKDIEVGKRFHEHLERRYREEHLSYTEILRDPELTDTERFYVMAYLFLIADVRDHLRRSIGMT